MFLPQLHLSPGIEECEPRHANTGLKIISHHHKGGSINYGMGGLKISFKIYPKSGFGILWSMTLSAGEWWSTNSLQQKADDGLYRLTTIIDKSSFFSSIKSLIEDLCLWYIVQIYSSCRHCVSSVTFSMHHTPMFPMCTLLLFLRLILFEPWMRLYSKFL